MADQEQNGKPAEGQQAAPAAQQAKPDAQGKPEPPAKPAATPEQKARRKFIAFSVAGLLLLVAIFFYYRSGFTEDTDDAMIDGDLYQVSSRVGGQVIKVNVTDNQPVQRGDIIAEIDPRDYQVALEQAQADLANSQASYVQASANVPITVTQTRTQVSTSGSDVATATAAIAQAQKGVAAAQARVEQQRANALKAQLDVERYKPLVEKDVISKQQFDQAVAQSAAANAALLEAQQNVIGEQAQVAQAQAKLNSAKSDEEQARENAPKQVQIQQARQQAANADIQQKQAKVDQAKLNLSYCRIASPSTGIINRKNVAVGQNLTTGQSLMTIVPLDNLWVTANFKETQLEKMQPGQVVNFSVDALGGRKYKGRLSQIGGATGSRLSLFPAENATGNYVKVVQRIPVRIDIDKGQNDDRLLRPGYSVVPDVDIK